MCCFCSVRQTTPATRPHEELDRLDKPIASAHTLILAYSSTTMRYPTDKPCHN